MALGGALTPSVSAFGPPITSPLGAGLPGISVKSDSIGGKVVISACEMSVVYRLPTIIAKLRELEPEINVEVIVASDPNAMQQHEGDIAICSVKPSYPNYIVRKVGIESRSLFGSRDYIQLNDVNNIDIGKK